MKKVSFPKNKALTKNEFQAFLELRPEVLKKNQAVEFQLKSDPNTTLTFHFNGSDEVSVYVQEKIQFNNWQGVLNPVLYQKIYRKFLEDNSGKLGIQTPIALATGDSFVSALFTITASGTTVSEVINKIETIRNDIKANLETLLLNIKCAVKKEFGLTDEFVSTK